jgi:hypothetical protein
VVTRPEDEGSMFLQNNVKYLLNYREEHNTKVIYLICSTPYSKFSNHTTQETLLNNTAAKTQADNLYVSERWKETITLYLTSSDNKHEVTRVQLSPPVSPCLST